MLTRSNAIRVWITILIVLLSSACSQATPQPTAVPPAQPTATIAPPPAATATLAPPTVTSAPAFTDTPAATLTATATPTPEPSATLTPLPALAVSSISGWCLPEQTSLAATKDPLNPPTEARLAQVAANALEVHNLPASACVFVYTFNQAAPAGLKLQVYESSGSGPWLTADLAPVDGSPQSAAVTLRHTYIVAPPFWNVSYQFSVVNAQGQELRREPVNLHRWVPKLCWNGRPPNVYTLRCPLPQDLHPWDPSYRTPMPTFAPGVDPQQGW